MKCDRCGAEFDMRPYLPSVFREVLVFNQITFGKADERSSYMLPQKIILCPACQKSFESWIRRGRKKK